MIPKNPTWFMARPLRQPIIGRRESVLACVTPGPLNLPGVCCRCGAPTDQSRPVKVVETSKADAVVSGAAFLAGHLGHIIAGARLLTQQKVAVPNCAACWSLHRRGFVEIGRAHV